jgi:hypothetical protein
MSSGYSALAPDGVSQQSKVLVDAVVHSGFGGSHVCFVVRPPVLVLVGAVVALFRRGGICTFVLGWAMSAGTAASGDLEAGVIGSVTLGDGAVGCVGCGGVGAGDSWTVS